MSSNPMDKFDVLTTLGMDQFSSISVDRLKQNDAGEIDRLLEIISELELDDLSSEQRWRLTSLVHFISTIQGNWYSRHFTGCSPQNNIRIMINEPAQKSGKTLYRGSQQTYDYPIGKKIDLGNRPFSEELPVAEIFAGKTIFHVKGEKYRINFKNDSMFPEEYEFRVRRGTTGVVTEKWVDDVGKQHYVVVIVVHPDEQTYDENVTGTANTHKTDE